MLAGVLLQMIQPPPPIEFAMDGVAHLGRQPLNYMHDTFVFRIDAINHAGIAKRSCVCRLPAAGRIERSAIEGDRDLAVIKLAQTDDTCIELEEAGILVVESLGRRHGDILICSLPNSKGGIRRFPDYTDNKLNTRRTGTVTTGTHQLRFRSCWNLTNLCNLRIK